MMYPKPPKKTKKYTKRNPVPTENSKCEVCGAGYAETHEIFYGPGNRKLSIKYGLQALLCAEHHRGMEGPHNNRKRDLELKRREQRAFEQWHGRSEFLRIFGRNYLDD